MSINKLNIKIMRQYYKDSQKIMKAFQPLSFNLESIKEFNEKNHNNIVIIPEFILNSNLSLGGSIKAKMFTLLPNNIIKEDIVYIKNAIINNATDKNYAHYKIESELLTEDIFRQLGIETVGHARMAVNEETTLLISRAKENIIYPQTKLDLYNNKIYGKVLELGDILGIRDFVPWKLNVGQVGNKALVIDTGYNINPLKPSYHTEIERLNFKYMDNKSKQTVLGKFSLKCSTRYHWLKDLSIKGESLMKSPDNDERNLGQQLKKFLQEKDITPSRLNIKLNIDNLKSTKYEGYISPNETEKLEGFASYIQNMRKRHLKKYPTR